jgi:flagellar hook-associated protein 1
MSLSSAAVTAQTGLSTNTAEAATLSQNIAGANATGIYSRKITNVISALDGSQVASVTRASNRAVFDNLLNATSANAMQQALSSGLDQLNQTIGSLASDSTNSAATSPEALLSRFTNALQTYEASPSDATLAAAAVNAAATLAQGLNSASATVNQVREQADSGIAASVQSINSLLAQFQAANAQIISGTAAGADVTDAQDTRDNILTQLSQQIGITTAPAPNGGISIFTDGGVTLFQGGVAKTVTFSPTTAYSAGTAGNAVYVDGVAITGSSSAMLSLSGNLVGLITLRDKIAVTYQAQLDNIANGLITSFAESDQAGTGPALPGLFTTPQATALPTSITGLAGQITVNPSADHNQGGNPCCATEGYPAIRTTYTIPPPALATRAGCPNCSPISRQQRLSAPRAGLPSMRPLMAMPRPPLPGSKHSGQTLRPKAANCLVQRHRR